MMKAIITGATKGIGKAIAISLIGEGYDLAVNSRNEEELKEFRNELLSLNPDAERITFAADMSKKNEVLELGAFVLD